MLVSHRQDHRDNQPIGSVVPNYGDPLYAQVAREFYPTLSRHALGTAVRLVARYHHVGGNLADRALFMAWLWKGGDTIVLQSVLHNNED